MPVMLPRSVVLALSFCLISTAAYAQSASAQETAAAPIVTVIAGPTTPPDPAALREAKRLSALGTKLFTEQVYEAAIPNLLQAYALAGKVGDLQKLARAYNEVGEFDHAHQAHELLLSAHSKELPRRDQVASKAALSELELKTTLVTIRCPEADASVTTGDRALGTTPFAKPVRLNARSQKFTIIKEGFEVWEQEATLTPNQPLALDVTLEPKVLTGHLALREVKNNPAHALIDGADKGPLPWEGDVSPGEHTVEAKGPRFAAPPRKVTVERRGKAEVVLEAAPTVAHLRVTTNVPTATISIDGAEIGHGTWEGELPTGRHKVAARAARYAQVEHEVTLEAGAPLLTHSLSLVAAGKSPAELEAEEADRLEGVYVDLGVFGAVGLHAPIDVTPIPGNATEVPSVLPLGGGARARVGYNFGVLGLHVVGGLLLDTRTATFEFPGTTSTTARPEAKFKHSEEYTLSTVAGFVGAGPSLTSKGQSVRATVAVAGGIATRNYTFSRVLTGGLTDTTSTSVDSLSPTFVWELGLLFGSTPGVKFELAIVGWLDVQSSTVEAPAQKGRGVSSTMGSGVTVDVPSFSSVAGPQFYIGPMIGIRFGH